MVEHELNSKGKLKIVKTGLEFQIGTDNSNFATTAYCVTSDGTRHDAMGYVGREEEFDDFLDNANRDSEEINLLKLPPSAMDALQRLHAIVSEQNIFEK